MTFKHIYLRLNPELKLQLEKSAKNEARSLNQYVALVLQAHVANLQRPRKRK